MKKAGLLMFAVVVFSAIKAQTPFQRVYTVLNQKCQNGTCHSATSTGDVLKFDGTETEVYNAIVNTVPSKATAVARFEKQVKPGHPYMSFLLRKIAGSGFDADLALQAGDGDLMKDVNGSVLSNKEIEFIRQWIMFGAKKTYGSNEPKPDWQLVSDYYDNPVMPFLPKPAKPNPGEGLQFRHGPVFLPVSGATEQEWLLQHEVNFPVLPEVYKIDGFMNQQSHHFLLFKFDDSTAAYGRAMGMQEVSITSGTTSFDGDKMLTSAWQDDAEFVLPTGTALFWEQKCYVDMNYHIKNYNATGVLPCDFYFNVYFRPRSQQTIEMKANLVNNPALFLPQGVQTRDYDDPDNNQSVKEWRYIWALTSHSHKYGTDFDIYLRDTLGNITEKLYEGWYSYENNYDKGFYDWEHPSIRYWDNLLPVKFGRHNNKRAGLVARTTWDVQEPFVTFGFTTDDEMQLFYYFYTNQPLPTANAVNDTEKGIYMAVFPNPVNGTGKMIYSLEKAATVEASVVDISGKTVAQLSKEQQEEGTHEITIGNGNNTLAKGIYFARLVVDGNVFTKKFIVAD